MPNWCIENVICIGDPEEIQDLYNRMERLQQMENPLVPNGLETTWLGNLVEDLGVDYNTVGCRRSWCDLLHDNGILSFTTECAWYRCVEVEELIMEKYPSIRIAFCCEEPGMGIYEKNDSELFPKDYIIDIEDDDIYYNTEEEALKTLSDFFGKDFKDMNEAMKAVNDHDDTPSIKVVKYDLVA